MDLSRVFGDSNAFGNNQQQPPQQQQGGQVFQSNASNNASNNNNAASLLANVNSQPQIQGAYEAGLNVRDNMTGMQNYVDRLQPHIKNLQRSIESTREAYEQIVRERDQMRSRLVSAEGRLGEVQKVVQRYTNVQEPVVASDGYTYERSIIQQYLEECEQNSVTPLSQLTKAELTNVLIPNQSLKKLVDLLKTVKPQAVPPPSSTASTQRKEEGNEHRMGPGARKTNGAANPPQEGRLHPCVRVYGFCNYKDMCTYALYPYDACLSHLKGKCRFGSQCHELHVDYRGKLQGNGGRSGQDQGSRQQGQDGPRQNQDQPPRQQGQDQQGPRQHQPRPQQDGGRMPVKDDKMMK